MNEFTAWMSQAWVDHLGWALLHSIWQGGAAAILYALSRIALRRRSAEARYWAGCMLLLLTLAAAGLTFMAVPLPGPASAPPTAATSTRMRAAPVSLAAGKLSSAYFSDSISQGLRSGFIERSLPWVVCVWLVGVSLLSARWIQGCRWVGRIRELETEALEMEWIRKLSELRWRMGVSRPVRLVRSALIEVPLVVGWLRPVILMPASSLLGLTPAQIEVILAHELAHIRRCDYLVNVLQKVVETLLFYHPAVWWISRSIREEREHCCDDLVVRICRDRMVYAQALFRLEQLRAVPAELALAATGGSLLRRVQRLLAASPDHWPVGPKEFGGLALVALGCVLFFSGLCFMLSTPIYRSTVRVCVECPWQSMRPLQSDRDRPYPTPYLLETEITVIESDLVLREVVDALKLSQAWAGKAHEKLTDAATLATLRKHLRVRPVQNTALIEVAVFDNDAAESAAIANAVATSYVKYRERQLQQARGTDLRALQSRIEQQDAQVRRAESNVEYLRVSLNVPDYISAAGAPPPTMPPEDLRKLERLRIEGQAELIRQQTLLEQLKSIPRDRLAGMMPTITGTPDTLLTSYLEQLNLAEQRQIALQKDYGPRHMDVIKVTDQASDLKDKIRERIEGILLGMDANVAAMRQRQINLSNEVYAAMESGLAKAKESRPYWDAKHQLDECQRFRQVLLMKMASEQTDASLPTPRAVEIVDHAGVPERQASPNRPRAGALLLAGMALMAIGMVLIRRSPISAATA